MTSEFETDKYESGYVPLYLERVHNPRRILEVGVDRGGSLLLWCALWPSVEIVVGIDQNPPILDLHDKVTVLQADQTDVNRLDQVGRQFGPFDLVIDDASHQGSPSWVTFGALWPHIAPGGIYVVEDWATGYWERWRDGSEYEPRPPPGHTAGMVGMVKRLVDEVGQSDLSRLEVMRDIVFAYR